MSGPDRLEALEAENLALRSELAEAAIVLRHAAGALPRHAADCLCELCTVRRQMLAVAAAYESGAS